MRRAVRGAGGAHARRRGRGVARRAQLTYARARRAGRTGSPHLLRARGVGRETRRGAVPADARSSWSSAHPRRLRRRAGPTCRSTPRYPAERLAFMLQDACIVVLRRTALVVELRSPRLPCVPVATGRRAGRATPPRVPSSPRPRVHLYTSGSTGRPKGAMVEHARHAAITSLGRGRATSSSTAGDAVAADGAGLLRHLGVADAVARWRRAAASWCVGEETVRDPVALLDERRRLRHHGGRDRRRRCCAPSSTRSSCAASRRRRQRAALADRQRRGAAGRALQRWAASVARHSAAQRLRPDRVLRRRDPPSSSAPTTASTGRCRSAAPSPTRSSTCSTRSCSRCRVGVPGELYIGGVGVGARLSRPTRRCTAERSCPIRSPPSRARGCTAPATARAIAPTATLSSSGRIDHQVKMRGFRIELGEIETRAARAADGARAAVVVREDHGGDARLVAYVVVATTASTLGGALRERARGASCPSTWCRRRSCCSRRCR